MLLKLLQAGDDKLRKKTKPLTEAQLKSKKIQELIDFMIATLDDAPGVGLAAPQVGEAIQLIIIHDKAEYHDVIPPELLKEQHRKPIPLTIIVNPSLKIIKDVKRNYFEGCLSVDGYVGVVARANQVEVTGLDRLGKPIKINASGWQARILQHEIDHLNGTLYIDRVNLKSFMTQKNFSLKWRKALQKQILLKFF